jgi:hypothetical protein
MTLAHPSVTCVLVDICASLGQNLKSALKVIIAQPVQCLFQPQLQSHVQQLIMEQQADYLCKVNVQSVIQGLTVN